MLQVARLAPRLLGDSTELVAAFLRSRLTADGGFADRAGESDLYYTVFGLEGLIALRAELPTTAVADYLRGFEDGYGLDFIHLTCLARCWAALPASYRIDIPYEPILRRIEEFRSRDGGYHVEPGAEHGTVYGCFLALGAYQDLGVQLPDAVGVLRCIASLRADDGGYANQVDVPMGLTPSTAAAVTLLRQLDQPIPREVGDWLLERCLPEGGFFGTPMAPIPDLLSTATALHALSGMQVDLEPVREPCLDFLDSLWVNRGAFYGNWTDDHADCEYTYYGLLALGHLGV
jgi:prenyltransferase beta subunit